ncbi:MAG: hypothetical protein FJ095_13950 [Deltaproteobacteria bacterium]|nr:hypothetical protein [Deltaproteobacteria bacterium]
MSTLETMVITQALAQALALTERALASVPAEDDLLVLLAERGLLLDRAESARLAGAPWGDVEAALARRIVATDEELLRALARTNADALAWLATRDGSALDDLPALAAICHPTVEPDELVPVAAPPCAALASAAARYSKTVLALL